MNRIRKIKGECTRVNTAEQLTLQKVVGKDTNGNGVICDPNADPLIPVIGFVRYAEADYAQLQTSGEMEIDGIEVGKEYWLHDNGGLRDYPDQPGTTGLVQKLGKGLRNGILLIKIDNETIVL